jgi:hypothetical protein
MPGLGRLTPQSQVFQSSGESTPAAQLPVKFISNTPAQSPISDQLSAPSGFQIPQTQLRVDRHERKVGMRYLYAKGHIQMPIERLGADGPPSPWNSAFNRNLHGPIHDAGFNDALYQAGYGGFNLQLSFKVPTLPQNGSGVMAGGPIPTRSAQKLVTRTQKLIRTRRATGQPKGT